jgi:hypothetical protein
VFIVGQPKTTVAATFGAIKPPEMDARVPVVGQHTPKHSPQFRVEDIHGTFEGVEKLASAALSRASMKAAI